MFSRFSASMSPERLVAVLNEIFTNSDSIADFRGLEKIKTIGDAYMAAAWTCEVRPRWQSASPSSAWSTRMRRKQRPAPGSPITLVPPCSCAASWRHLSALWPTVHYINRLTHRRPGDLLIVAVDAVQCVRRCPCFHVWLYAHL
ncbi:hypothetical protein KDW95_00965 [Marinobacterium rhizophilum]|uniref:Guanylate cyclase domain-containing protein n=1 Tax=Marinobacterium rhizophilum TaxID=420402 RepID=A0ABY5HM02_9GAMM|nr:hypothetical protein KDW95_00965 [Marinobacterium rhizophilum]